MDEVNALYNIYLSIQCELNIFLLEPTKAGMGCVGLDEEEKILFTSQHCWESDNTKFSKIQSQSF